MCESRSRGFTLIELMVVVAVVAVIAAFAVPAYNDYVTRSKITEATSGLSELRLRAEKFFADNRTYAGFSTAVGSSKYFAFSCPTQTATAFTCRAEGRAGAGMGGFRYEIDQDNTRSSTFTGVSGWNNSSTCWVSKKGETC